jgi:hypothetical protein
VDRPQTHYGIDQNGAQLAAEAAGIDDELLTPAETAQWLRKSTQWLEFGRAKGFGPPFIRLGRNVRYRRGDVRQYLVERTTRHEAA